MHTTDLEIDIYPVGVLADLKSTWRALTLPTERFPAALTSPVTPSWRINQAGYMLRHAWRTVLRQVKARKWRALKNVFNGYLAEPREFPPGDYRRRCGTGWTKRRALRSLERRLPSPDTRPLPSSEGGDS